MGLQGQLNDVSDSIPLLVISIVASFIGNFRSSRSEEIEPAGSGLAEQLDMNRASSRRFDGGDAPECVVCLSTIVEGEHVRRLSCRHVFHEACLAGWLDRLNFSCPVCRATLVSGERVNSTRRRVGRDLVSWFALR